MNEQLILCPECGKHTANAPACDHCQRAIPQEWRDEQVRDFNESRHRAAPVYGPPPQPWDLAGDPTKPAGKRALWLLLLGLVVAGIALVVYLT